MEHQLINALIGLLSKTSGESLIHDLVREVEESGNQKVWTPAEIEKALRYITWQTANFGTAEASAIIESLITRYQLRAETFAHHDDNGPATGIKGLQ